MDEGATSEREGPWIKAVSPVRGAAEVVLALGGG